MILQILWLSRDRVGFEVLRRTDNRQAHFFGHTNCDHVSLDEFTQLDASVVLPSHEVDRIIRRGYLQDNLRIIPRELRELREKYHLRRSPGDYESNTAGWLLPLLHRFRNRLANSFQSGC